jgi:hypothetical protein
MEIVERETTPDYSEALLNAPGSILAMVDENNDRKLLNRQECSLSQLEAATSSELPLPRPPPAS